ncbi:MAG: SLBB domain-containing protein [Bacteroidota bacterium]
MKKTGILIFVFVLIAGMSFAQIEDPKIKEEIEKRGISEEEAKQQLDKHNLTEDQVKKELESRGLIAPDRPAATAAERLKKQEQERKEAEAKALQDAKKVLPQPEVDEPKPVGPSEEEPEPEEFSDLVYGQHFFKENSFTLIEPNDNFKAPDNYIVGAGDEFTVTAWGNVEFSSSYLVNKEGFIKPFQLPRIFLKGLTFKDAREAIISNFGNVMDLRSGFNQIEVTISYSRPITVGVYGEVVNPGSYSFAAMNSALNALGEASGPAPNGSVRLIKVLHSDQSEALIDLYKFLGNPEVKDNVFLQDNDIIFVPTAGKVVSIEGAVIRPYKYELLQNEGLLDLIRHSGGLKPEAYRNNIQIERFVDDRQVLLDVNLMDLLSTNSDYELLPGDKVNIYLVEEPFRNFVTAEGAVELSGKYELRDGMRLLDVIQKSGLKEDARLDQVYILRKADDLSNNYLRLNLNEAINNPDSDQNVVLRPLDKIRVASKSTFVTDYEVSVLGEVRNPGIFEFDENLQISDLLYFSGGPKLEAADVAILERTRPDNTTATFRVNISEILNDPNSADNLNLEPRDQLVVYPKSNFADQLTVEIFGAIRSPGPYNFFESMTLKDLLFLSGGLREEAANDRIEISRLQYEGEEKVSVVIATLAVEEDLSLSTQDEFLLQPRDQIFVRSLPEFEVQRNVEVIGEVLYPGVYPIVDKNERLLSLVERAGGISESAFPAGATLVRNEDSIGYILLDLDKVLKNPDSRFNYVLKDGDVINIPKTKDLVSITGAVKHPAITAQKNINVPYHKGKRARFYINKYGTGIDKKRRGRKKLIFVEDPNGFVKKTKNYGVFKIYPKVEKGSLVSVQPKSRKEKKERDEDRQKTDWGQVITNSVSSATAVLTLVVLINQAFR